MDAVPCLRLGGCFPSVGVSGIGNDIGRKPVSCPVCFGGGIACFCLVAFFACSNYVGETTSPPAGAKENFHTPG